MNSTNDNDKSVAVAEPAMDSGEIAEVVNNVKPKQFLTAFYIGEGKNFSSHVRTCSRNEIVFIDGFVVRLTPNGWECAAGGGPPVKVTGIRVENQDGKEDMK